MLEIFGYQLSYHTLSLLLLAAFLIGAAKTGVSGATMFAVPMMAVIFGGKMSSGLMLPMLIMADLFAVKYYHRHANWQHLIKLFPASAIGVVVATWLGNYVNDDMFRLIMSIIIFASLTIMVWMETKKQQTIPDYLWFAFLMGFLGGFTTMIGNLAGAIMSLYLLSMRLPKNEYIGTAAWFFLVINIFKIPFHVVIWETIDVNSFLLNLVALPFVALGAYVGIKFVKNIPEKQYRWLVIIMTGIAALYMVA